MGRTALPTLQNVCRLFSKIKGYQMYHLADIHFFIFIFIFTFLVNALLACLVVVDLLPSFCAALRLITPTCFVFIALLFLQKIKLMYTFWSFCISDISQQIHHLLLGQAMQTFSEKSSSSVRFIQRLTLGRINADNTTDSA